jgi:hypothetical protein
MSARGVGFAIALGAVGAAAHGQTGPFTEAQAAAGRSSYLANCAGCHLADLRGANESRPLVGPDFMRTWGGRSAQELVACLGVTMPPPPATPGSLGTRLSELAAFCCTRRRDAATALTAHHSRDRSVATSTTSSAALATAAPAPRAPPANAGISVAGQSRISPMTDAMLRLPADDG